MQGAQTGESACQLAGLEQMFGISRACMKLFLSNCIRLVDQETARSNDVFDFRKERAIKKEKTKHYIKKRATFEEVFNRMILKMNSIGESLRLSSRLCNGNVRN